MAQINLKDYYPDYYHEDHFIDAPDEVVEVLQTSKRESLNHQRNIFRQHMNYSFDYHNGVENQVLCPVLSAEELFLQLQTSNALAEALASLSPTQARRISLKFFDNLSNAQIAKQEHISLAVVNHSLEKALKNLKKPLAEK